MEPSPQHGSTAIGTSPLIVLPGTNRDEAATVAEKLRQAIAGMDIPVVGHKTASFGVASHNPGEPVESLLTRADRALYKTKENGRNRVQVAT